MEGMSTVTRGSVMGRFSPDEVVTRAPRPSRTTRMGRKRGAAAGARRPDVRRR